MSFPLDLVFKPQLKPTRMDGSNWIGRRWTIFGFEIINVASCLWQAFAPSWQHLFAGRFVMGLSIGINPRVSPEMAGP